MDLLSKLLKPGITERKMVNIPFIVESLPQSFENLQILIEKLINVKETTVDDGRTYSIIACLRLLRINIETLVYWRKESETLNSLAMRTVHGHVNWENENNFILKLKKFLFSFIFPEEENEVSKTEDFKSFDEIKNQTFFEKTNNDEITELIQDEKIDKLSPKNVKREQTSFQKQEIKQDNEEEGYIVVPPKNQVKIKIDQNTILKNEISTVVAKGFTIFFNSHEDQQDFILESIKEINKSFKLSLLEKVLQNMLEYNTEFETFWIKNMIFNDFTKIFFTKIIIFLKTNTLYCIKEKRYEKKDIVNLFCKVLLLWQTIIFSKLEPKDFDKKKESTNLLIFYTQLMFDSFIEIIQTSITVFEKDYQVLEDFLEKSMIGTLFFPLIQLYLKMLWKTLSTSFHKSLIIKLPSECKVMIYFWKNSHVIISIPVEFLIIF